MKFCFQRVVYLAILVNLSIVKSSYCSSKFEIDEELDTSALQNILKENGDINFITNQNGKALDFPLNHRSTSSSRYCRFRDFGLYPPELWAYLTSGMCYYYTDPSRLTNALPIGMVTLTYNNEAYVFYITIVNGTYTFFDFRDEQMNKIVAATFTTTAFYEKWYDCCQAAEHCCQNEMNETNVLETDEYPCPAVWDGWTCYPPARAGTMNRMECPLYSISASSFPCTLYSQKYCFSNGTWNQTTDYTGCSTTRIFRRRLNFHVIVLYISLGISFPAVIIFLSHKKLNVLRINLHRNLLLACICRNILTILVNKLILLDALQSEGSNAVMLNNGVGCRVLAYFEGAAVNAIYSCMLMEGYYLHKLIVRIFSDDPNAYLLYGISLGLAFLPTSIWAILKATLEDTECWVTSYSGFSWVQDSFRLVVLLVNTCLLIDICRVLLLKLRRNSNTQHNKATVKAMLFLVPLFGIPFLFTVDESIAGDSCVGGDVFHFFSYSFQALQGICVAVVFCYWNKEVHTQIKFTYRRLTTYMEQKYGWKTRRDTQTMKRATATTLVRPSTTKPLNADARRVPGDLLTGAINPTRLSVPTEISPPIEPNQVNDLPRRLTKFLEPLNDDGNEDVSRC